MKCRHCGGSGEEPEAGTAVELHENGNGKKPRTLEEIKASLSTVLAEVSAGQQKRFKTDEVRTIQARLVFAFWQAEMHHPMALADDKRIGRIKRCLKENGGNVHELLYAIEGWRRDKTFQRFAEEGRVLDGIENIFRDRGMIERLAGHRKGYQEGRPHGMAVRYLEGLST